MFVALKNYCKEVLVLYVFPIFSEPVGQYGVLGVDFFSFCWHAFLQNLYIFKWAMGCRYVVWCCLKLSLQ